MRRILEVFVVFAVAIGIWVGFLYLRPDDAGDTVQHPVANMRPAEEPEGYGEALSAAPEMPAAEEETAMAAAEPSAVVGEEPNAVAVEEPTAVAVEEAAESPAAAEAASTEVAVAEAPTPVEIEPPVAVAIAEPQSEVASAEGEELLASVRPPNEYATAEAPSQAAESLLASPLAGLSVEAAAASEQAVTAEAASPISSSELESLLEQQIEKVAWPAKTSIAVREAMTRDQRYGAMFVVERGPGGATARLVDESGLNILKQIDVRTTDDVMATLEGVSFDITTSSPQWQTVTTQHPAAWTWKVIPREEGPLILTFGFFHKVIVDGIEHVVSVDRYPQSVTVTVGFWARLYNFLGPVGVIVTILAGVATIVIAWVTLRPGRGPTQANGLTDEPGPGGHEPARAAEETESPPAPSQTSAEGRGGGA